MHEAKTHLSRYARRVKAGERILLCERNVPFAEIRPLEQSDSVKRIRPLGLDQGRSEEHTSELQSRPHISYAVFCLKKKNKWDAN